MITAVSRVALLLSPAHECMMSLCELIDQLHVGTGRCDVDYVVPFVDGYPKRRIRARKHPKYDGPAAHGVAAWWTIWAARKVGV